MIVVSISDFKRTLLILSTLSEKEDKFGLISRWSEVEDKCRERKGRRDASDIEENAAWEIWDRVDEEVNM